MKTIPEYLSGSSDEELRVLAAEARGWTKVEGTIVSRLEWYWRSPSGMMSTEADQSTWLPKFSTSRDACEQLLADLTEAEVFKFTQILINIVLEYTPDSVGIPATLPGVMMILRATGRQICVAYLITKGILQ